MMRKNYIDWDCYFMGIAILSAMRSKDPNTQVGACIVNQDHRIIGVGYNGFPAGCKDEDFPWAREGDLLDTKYPYVCHAELNAILNSIKSLKDCIIYVGLFPCNECSKAIIQSGIKEVVYLSNKYAHTDTQKASQKMLDSAGVKYRQLQTEKEKIELYFDK
ncbi:dCMP deaminase family protein [Pasteurella atlantica]|nr:dCMP deaminase family protein [Pasteurella atlantica]QVE21909.1 dCMP deaminase family protein [Pasteurella atlantica]